MESIHAQGGEEKTIAARNSAIGNGFHIPSVMMALIVLFQLAPQVKAIARNLRDPQEQAMGHNSRNTALDDYYVEHFPGLLGPGAVVSDMQQQLPAIGHTCWEEVRLGLGRARLDRLQRYWFPEGIRPHRLGSGP